MLSISKAMRGTRSAEYYLELAREDYYTRRGNEPGQWFGKGAEKLGLQDKVEAEAFKNLILGFSPDGQQPLVQNAGHEKRQGAWDLTLSAPKSVSVLWALGPDQVRQEIEQAHREAVQEALGFIQETAGFTRRGKEGRLAEHAGLVFATFLHGESRALEPQIHTHCVALNVSVRDDGTTGAIRSRDFFQAKMSAGLVYQAGFARRLEKIGLTILPDKVAFRVDGVPQELCSLFSTRRKQIKRRLKELGFSTAKAASLVANETRAKKEHITRAELLETARQRAEAFGWGPKEAAKLVESMRRQQHSEQSVKTDREDLKAGSDPHKIGQRHAPEKEEPARGQPSQAARSREEPRGQSSDSQNQNTRSHEEPNREKEETRQQQSKEQPRNDGKNEQSDQGNQKTHRENQSRDGERAERKRAKKRRRADDAESRRLFKKMFKELRREAAKLSRKEFTRKNLIAIGIPIATKYMQHSEALARAVDKLLEDPGFIRVEKRSIFRHAPAGSLADKFRLPVIAIGTKRPKWGKIRWKQNLLIGELRIQQKNLFRKAPWWNPLRKASLPAVRFVSNRANRKVDKFLDERHRRCHG